MLLDIVTRGYERDSTSFKYDCPYYLGVLILFDWLFINLFSLHNKILTSYVRVSVRSESFVIE